MLPFKLMGEKLSRKTLFIYLFSCSLLLTCLVALLSSLFEFFVLFWQVNEATMYERKEMEIMKDHNSSSIFNKHLQWKSLVETCAPIINWTMKIGSYHD
jgi:hypothetical protein